MWKVRGNDIVFIDSSSKLMKPHTKTELEEITVTDDGIAANELQDLLSEMRVADLQKYRGKYLEMNGQITGFGRGMNSTEYFIALDGGDIRLYFKADRSNTKIYNRLRLRCEKWRKDGGLKKMREKKRELEKNFEDIDRATLAEPQLFLNFKALCSRVDLGKLIFKDPEFAFIKSTGEYLIKDNL